MTSPSSSTNESFDPDHRELCSNPSCLGVIDDTGCCKVCGIESNGAALSHVPTPPVLSDLPMLNPMESRQPDFTEAEPFEDRELCRNENCLGLIDPTGHCNLCHQSVSTVAR